MEWKNESWICLSELAGWWYKQRVGQNLCLLPSLFTLFLSARLPVLGHPWCWGPRVTGAEKGIQTPVFCFVLFCFQNHKAASREWACNISNLSQSADGVTLITHVCFLSAMPHLSPSLVPIYQTPWVNKTDSKQMNKSVRQFQWGKEEKREI